MVTLVFRDHSKRGIPVSRALVDDDEQQPAGAAWRHIEDMARRHLVLIDNGIAILNPLFENEILAALPTRDAGDINWALLTKLPAAAWRKLA